MKRKRAKKMMWMELMYGYAGGGGKGGCDGSKIIKGLKEPVW